MAVRWIAESAVSQSFCSLMIVRICASAARPALDGGLGKASMPQNYHAIIRWFFTQQCSSEHCRGAHKRSGGSTTEGRIGRHCLRRGAATTLRVCVRQGWKLRRTVPVPRSSAAAAHRALRRRKGGRGSAQPPAPAASERGSAARQSRRTADVAVVDAAAPLVRRAGAPLVKTAEGGRAPGSRRSYGASTCEPAARHPAVRRFGARIGGATICSELRRVPLSWKAPPASSGRSSKHSGSPPQKTKCTLPAWLDPRLARAASLQHGLRRGSFRSSR